ncbi:MAG: glycerol-3-phosphate responsive antiterminator [Clostridiaceae bacterium]|jgi:glycerol uptake operon antiterminator|nr:glycerol-3-phosphate responsive antiterminator [Clostridiaceae bacterium]
MKNKLLQRIEENPIIAAVRNEMDIQEAVLSPVSTIFLLQADIFNIQNMVDRIKDAGKSVIIHIDFLDGIGRDNRAMDYICEVIQPHGIISTKNSSIRYAMSKNMFTIQRIFLIDSLSYENSIRTAQSTHPDMVEVMPGIMPKVIRRISRQLHMPVIAGGLIESKEDVIEILNAGALAISTGKKVLWES